jgi:PKD repeat protein
MGKRGLLFGIFLIIVSILINSFFISASFEKATDSYSLTKKIYAPTEFLEGWINIKLQNEKANSILETDFGDKIELLEFLKRNDADYTCSPLDCTKDYSVMGQDMTTKTVQLNGVNSTMIGLKFTGVISRINSINLSIESNAPASCENQMRVDFFNDGSIEILNNKASSASCEDKNYGCFDSSKDIEYLSLGRTPYCQKINLSEAAGFRGGAWIKGTGGKPVMQLYSENGNKINNAQCEISGITAQGGEFSCNINYSTSGGEHYLCISSETGDYQIKSNSNPSKFCGFYGTPVRDNAGAYSIFIEKRKFDVMGKIKIGNVLPDGRKLSDMILDYIGEKYGSLDCSSECIIPVKINTYAGQSVTVSEERIEYEKTSGNVVENRFYNIEEIPAEINSDFQRLYLKDGGFEISREYGYGNKTIRLSLNNEEIFSDEITVKKISEVNSVNPTTTAAAVPTEFTANITSENGSDIIEYKWEFGDGENMTTEINKVTHTYSDIENYKLKVTIEDSKGFTNYNIFDISVGSPRNVANITIKNKEKNLEEIKTELEDYPAFYKETVYSILNISYAEEKLAKLKTDYENAETEEDFIDVMKGLVELKIPDFLFTSKELEESPYLQKEENIDLDVIEKITSESYDSSKENEYFDAINGWFVEKIDVRIIYEEISGEYGEAYEPIFNVFTFKIDSENYNDKYYLILKDLENLKFMSNYGEKTEGDYIYMELDGDREITFSTTENIDFTDIPVFITAPFSKLTLVSGEEKVCNENKVCEKDRGENWRNCKDCSKSNIILIAIGGLIIAAIIAYFVLYYWYEKRYENHLFKSKNSLYNIVNYINNAKARGITEEDIRKNLRKVGWTPEQITYALKKYQGRKTGMFGFNVFRK